MTERTERHGWALIFALAASSSIAILIAGCGSQPSAISSQPVEAQLAAACDQAAAMYKDAGLLYATGQLPPSGVAVFSQAEPVVNAACDPANPATDPTTALAALSAVLNQMAIAKAQAKGQ